MFAEQPIAPVFKILTPVFTFFFLGISLISFSQKNRCGTVEYTQRLERLKFKKEREADFEQWIDTKFKISRAASHGRTKTTTYRIPVVVHVIHNGEPVGQGSNISDEQILSQIKVLNADFQRKNADTVNTPAEFQDDAGKMDIEFMLAKRSPDGRSSNGIVRVQGTRSSWTSNDNYEIKELSYWPAEDYLNIWVCEITDYLGYSQFPVSDLPGLEGSPENRLTDGLVIWHRVFGSIDDGNFNLDPDYNKGRTVTHEISHFFGLRHIWGDVTGCTGTDYVNDTPSQNNYTSGCPAHPKTSCDPPVVTMFQNFQDYTDDACMNLFTKEQIERMELVLQNSPRRKTLFISPGLLPPDPVNNDCGLVLAASPQLSPCSETLTPQVTLKNFGINNITTARVKVSAAGLPTEIKNFSLSLAPGNSTTLSFNNITFPTGTTTLNFEILLVNGVTDGDPVSNDNVISTTIYIPAKANIPFVQNFSGIENWRIENPDNQVTWQQVSVPKESEMSQALVLPFYEYGEALGEQDILYSPVFDLSNISNAVLFFELAHAYYNFHEDRLKVVAITDCSNVDDGVVIYDKKGADLSTVSINDGYFTPSSAKDWRTEKIDLTDFTGTQYLQLAFIGINGYGNNLYLDNINVGSTYIDLQLKQIISPSLVTCGATEAQILVTNTGTETINNFTINYALNNAGSQTADVTDLNLQSGDSDTITFSPLSLVEGQNLLQVSVKNPNGQPDLNTENNSITSKVVVNSSTDLIPLRQNFEDFDNTWTIVNPGTGMNWDFKETNYKESIYYNAFNNPKSGDESWLVTPVLDFSKAQEASLLFDISYRSGNRKDALKILASDDCGNTYKPLNYSVPQNEALLSEEWTPALEEDWQKQQYVDLTEFTGKSQVRIAFVVTNSNGNNLYLDSVEFFISKDQRLIDVEKDYSVFGYVPDDFGSSTFKVGFNLEQRQPVACEVVDPMGKLVGRAQWSEVLNQIFDLPLPPDAASGLYIVRVNIGGAYSFQRIFKP